MCLSSIRCAGTSCAMPGLQIWPFLEEILHRSKVSPPWVKIWICRDNNNWISRWRFFPGSWVSLSQNAIASTLGNDAKICKTKTISKYLLSVTLWLSLRSSSQTQHAIIGNRYISYTRGHTIMPLSPGYLQSFWAPPRTKPKGAQSSGEKKV